MSAPPDKPVDHKRMITLLAKDSTVPIGEITRLYEHEWAALEASARVKRFIPIFTTRNVRKLLRQGRMEAKIPISR